MKLPSLKIGNKISELPIIQGGMGIGISMANLSSAVANQGGIGIISAAQPGYNEMDFETNNKEANIRGLRNEIRKAKSLSSNGIIGVNIMVAMKNYKEMIITSVEEKADLIISGAGLPMDLPEMIKGTETMAAPVVSSGRAIALIAKIWDKRYSYLPDAVVVEGPKAGGHLGFNMEQLSNIDSYEITDIVKEVIDALKPFEEKYGRKVPVIAAGGIYTGEDIAKCLKAGAAGVQMATRFVATYECDADIRFKEAYLNAKEEDIKIVKSPVGMPGRAVKNKFMEETLKGNIEVKKCFGCIKTCNPLNTPYCITRALINAANGNLNEGLIFVGANAYKIDKLVSVKELMEELTAEAEAALE